MKKSLLSAFAMIIASCGIANANIQITAYNVEQPANDTLMFALPVDVNHYQDIQNYPEQTPNVRMMKFQPEYVVTATDFTKGDVNKGTATLPANAKVIGLGLDGYDVGSQNTPKGIFLEVVAWCRNIPTGSGLENLDFFDGYNNGDDEGKSLDAAYRLPIEDLYTDTVTYHGYYLGSVRHPGYICTFDENATAENPGTIVDIPFGNPEDTNRPFWYKGENIYLYLYMCNWFDVRMKYRYMTFDDAEMECASLMRSGNFCFNNETAALFGDDLPYDLPDHRLPAFRTPYFTNDVRVTLTDQDAEIQLQDENGNIYDPDEDGNFYSLDHTQSYSIIIDGIDSNVQFGFDDIYSDVNLLINVDLTAVEEISGTKTLDSVVYYNLAGQQSNQPFDGVNIAVSTYSDGTRTTSKVIK